MSVDTQSPKLFKPITFRGLTVRNRVVASPMCQYHSVDGGPTDWQMVHVGRMAVGGAGIVFGEETAVEDIGRKNYACAGIWDDRHIPQYRRITDFVREQGSVPAIQIGHSGRKAACHTAIMDFAPLTDSDAANGMAPWQPLAPSPINAEKRFYPPKEMDRDDIRRILEKFREAARRSKPHSKPAHVRLARRTILATCRASPSPCATGGASRGASRCSSRRRATSRSWRARTAPPATCATTKRWPSAW